MKWICNKCNKGKIEGVETITKSRTIKFNKDKEPKPNSAFSTPESLGINLYCTYCSAYYENDINIEDIAIWK